jgi:small subunit ribosomal protein S19
MYRGKTIEELQSLSIKEVSQLFPSRQRRSLTRELTDQQKIFLTKIKNSKKNTIKTQCRDIIILPNMVDKIIQVYNGKEYVSVRVIPEMIGHYLGEFSLTRKKVSHSAPGIGATRSSASVSVR